MTDIRTVISLATAARPYERDLRRLERSVRRVRFDGEFIGWHPGTFPAECPEHSDAPFAFKPFCLDAARRDGRQLALWIDASCVVVRPLDGLFTLVESQGYVLFRNRAYVIGQWASDLALERLGLTRDEAMRLPEVNAAVVGLDLGNPRAEAFLERWLSVAGDGETFRGVVEPLESPSDHTAVKKNIDGRVSADPRVQGHRHDQTVAGVIAHDLGLTLTSGVIANVRRLRSVVEPETSVLKVRGAGSATIRATMLRVTAGDRLARRTAPQAPESRVAG